VVVYCNSHSGTSCRKEMGLEVNTDKTQHMFVSHYQNAG
jgi:hypothetical protein